MKAISRPASGSVCRRTHIGQLQGGLEPFSQTTTVRDWSVGITTVVKCELGGTMTVVVGDAVGVLLHPGNIALNAIALVASLMVISWCDVDRGTPAESPRRSASSDVRRRSRFAIFCPGSLKRP